MPDSRIRRPHGRERPVRRYDPDRLTVSRRCSPPRDARPPGLSRPLPPAGPATRLRTPGTRPRRPDEAVARYGPVGGWASQHVTPAAAGWTVPGGRARDGGGSGTGPGYGPAPSRDGRPAPRG